MNWKPHLETAEKAARAAGDLLIAHRDEEHRIGFKGAVDLVTDMDERSQVLIHSIIATRFPDHDFLAEEGLDSQDGSEYRWIFDPLDGTTNFAHGFPVFSVSIALQERGRMVLGVIFDPLRREMFTAVEEKGAYLNGRRIAVSAVRSLNRSLLATGFPYDVRESAQNNLDHFADFAVRAQALRRCGSAALDLCYVACGRFDGFWELKLAPWDVAAGILLVREAGGRVTDFRGDELDIFDPEVLASNGLVHDEMIRVLELRLDSRVS